MLEVKASLHGLIRKTACRNAHSLPGPVVFEPDEILHWRLEAKERDLPRQAADTSDEQRARAANIADEVWGVKREPCQMPAVHDIPQITGSLGGGRREQPTTV